MSEVFAFVPVTRRWRASPTAKRAQGAPTLRWLRSAAKRWSHPASFSPSIMWNRWGPAHELGHVLVAGDDDGRYHFAYGLCGIETCDCTNEWCLVVECASMIISRALLTAAGYPDVAELEHRQTEGVEFVVLHRRRARALLKRIGLWPVPVTILDLESALERRCAPAPADGNLTEPTGNT